IAPLIYDKKSFCGNDSSQYRQDPKVPGIVAVDALLFGIPYADPKPEQHARGDQETIRGQTEIANVKESRKHGCLDAECSLTGEQVLGLRCWVLGSQNRPDAL